MPRVCIFCYELPLQSFLQGGTVERATSTDLCSVSCLKLSSSLMACSRLRCAGPGALFWQCCFHIAFSFLPLLSLPFTPFFTTFVNRDRAWVTKFRQSPSFVDDLADGNAETTPSIYT